MLHIQRLLLSTMTHMMAFNTEILLTDYHTFPSLYVQRIWLSTRQQHPVIQQMFFTLLSSRNVLYCQNALEFNKSRINSPLTRRFWHFHFRAFTDFVPIKRFMSAEVFTARRSKLNSPNSAEPSVIVSKLHSTNS